VSQKTFNKTSLKVFIASSQEVKAERSECVQIINKLRSAHPHLDIECVHWEYNMPHTNYPGHKNIQAAINESQLKDCSIVIFIFFSRIGKFTREEFEYATNNNKRIFIYFKEGFTPQDLPSIEAWTDLIKFKESLNEIVLYEQYIDVKDFERLLYINLNLYFSQAFAVAAADAQTTEELIKRLEEQEGKRKELENQLAVQQQNDALKTLALEQVKRGDYEAAEKNLLQSAMEGISKTASTFFELGKIKELEFQYNEAYDYFKLAAKISPQNREYLNAASSAAMRLGYYNDAQDIDEKILKELTNNEGLNAEVATLYNNIGVLLRSKGFPDKSIEYLKKALKIERLLLKPNDPSLAITYNNLGLAFRDKGEYKKAINYYKKAFTIDKNAYGEQHQKVAIRYNNLGDVYSHIDKLDEALKCFLKALGIHKKIGTPPHEIAWSHSNLAGIYYDKGDLAKATEYYKKALDDTIAVYGENHPVVAVFYNNYANTFKKEGDYKTALTYYKKALSIGKKFHGEEHPDIAVWLANIGLIYTLEKNYTEAISYIQKAFLMSEKIYADKHPNMGLYKANLGFCYEQTGDTATAINCYRSSLDILNKFFPANHSDIKRVEGFLADALGTGK